MTFAALRSRWMGPLAAILSAVLALALLTAVPSQAHDGEHGDAHVLIFTETAAFRHTEAINQGVPALEQAFADVGITSQHTEDSSVFNDEDLSHFDALVMFQTSGDPWTADEKAALERYQQAGGGIVAIHNAADMRGDYQWWDDLIGSLMPGHAATGTSPGQPGTVRIEDEAHPSTQHLPKRWDRADEWYNFSTSVRGDAHVIATMDETTYDPGSNGMGYDHPISWCKPYDGGRAWVTAMGHFGAHYTEEPDFVQHIVGGVEWAAGLAEGDCGGTKWDQYERVPLDTNTSAPFGIAVAPDGRVFFSELVRGEVRVYDPGTKTTSTAMTLDVYSGGEDGLLGMELDPDFENNGYLYIYYAPASEDDTDPANYVSRVSRFTVGDGSQIDPASEELIIEVPASRLPDEPGHTGGDLAFGPDGTLYISVGDDVNPHSEPSGGYAPLSEVEGTWHDARATSANTNDLRGKVLRIQPEAGGGYSIPEGNLFSEGTADTRPEIYAMGFRNPFRFTVDPQTGWLGVADYGPDNGSSNPDRGPAGIVEWNLIKDPGFYGWPLCIGPNEPYRDVDYTTDPETVGDYFDCNNPINDSTKNTGLTELPAAQEPEMYYGYEVSSVPEVIPAGAGLAPMGGPFYDYDPALESDTKFPEYFEDKPFFYEWAKNEMYSIDIGGGDLEKVNEFLPGENWMAPIDSEFGPDGSLYVLDWGGGFGRDNPDSGLYRVDYISGSRSPSAVVDASPDSGQAPLTVQFDGSASSDPEGEALSYEWDFDGDGTIDATSATAEYTFTETGVYNARLTVTDPAGKEGTTTVPITVGNTRPEVDFNLPPNGAFFNFGDEISWDVDVTDAEDESVDDSDIVIQPALGHDEHAHPAEPLSGRTGSVDTALGGGHGEDMYVFYVLDARYEDSGGDGAPSLTGSDTTLLFPKKREAEFFQNSEGITTADSRDIEGHGSSITGQDGAWASYDPVSLANIDNLVLRAASSSGGSIELRRDAPDGELLATADVPDTGTSTSYVDVPVAVTDPGDTFELFVVFPGSGERRLNFIEGDGKGASPTTKPEVAVTSPTSADDLDPGDIQVTADASDEENTITEVEFFVDGESIGTDASAPYETTWSVSDEQRYELTAVATNDLGVSTTSRIVQVEVGDLFGDWLTYSNADGVVDRPDTDTWVIESGGANMWQGTDEYTSAYLPAAAGEQWTATVRVDSQTESHSSAKAGLIVRNDVTQPGSSPGYSVLAMRAGNAYEWLHDADGNGQLETSVNAGSHGYPAWVRLVRDGDQYYGYWSSDGETWSSAGDPISPEGAASLQDVGVAVTAHSTSDTSVAEFGDFTLDDTAWYPDDDPDPDPDPAPTCPTGVASDDFESGELDTSRWAVVREAEGLPVSVTDGGLVLPVTNGDINESSGGPISYVGQPVRDGEWVVETELTIDHTREWQHAGLMMHGDDDNYVKYAFTIDSGGERFLEFQTEAGGSRSWHDSQTLASDFPATIHLRLTSDGTQLTAAYSADGETWTDLAGAADIIDGATIGLMGAGDTGAHEVDARFEHFTITPDGGGDGGDVEPNDEFDGDAIDGCRWDSIVRYDGSHVEVSDGALRVNTQLGDINGGNNDDPNNFILQQMPEGDWTVETRLTPTMLHQWQLAGLLVYGDDDNYVKFDVVASNGASDATELGAELVSEVGGDFGGGGNRQLDIAESTESGWYELRLTKSGDTYAAEISGDGINWTSLGDPVTNDAALDSFGLMAIGPQQEEAVEVAFDYFHYTEAQADTTAPTLEVTTSPESADGSDGWFTTAPVEVSASAEDDSGSATIQTRSGDSDWVEYTAAMELFVDGSYDMEFRAVDAAGNTSEVVPVSVSLDATVPEVGTTVLGSFAGMVNPLDESGVSGSAELTVAADATTATLSLTGLEAGAVYDSHLHSGTCADPGPHYRDDPNGAGEPPNELWPTSDGESHIVANGDGEATASAEAAWAARSEARAVMVHDEAGDMVACATLGLVSERAQVVASASDQGSGTGDVEIRVDGGDWTSYDEPVAIDGEGDHAIDVRAADVAGNTTDSAVEFSIVTHAGTFELIEELQADGVLHQSEYAQLNAHLSTAERKAGQEKTAQAERALDRVLGVTEDMSDGEDRDALAHAVFVLRNRL